ncbi:hypothetical protein H920_18695 [Fukomys damarensis]|uniref:Uncharacterized protein n=1 Tax=Fukomys damarensis TaxID=885580 RepID=A0A091CQA5_FUKDA|nr:hypothetical protein H920_18695 [Fukomys damarensis]
MCGAFPMGCRSLVSLTAGRSAAERHLPVDLELSPLPSFCQCCSPRSCPPGPNPTAALSLGLCSSSPECVLLRSLQVTTQWFRDTPASEELEGHLATGPGVSGRVLKSESFRVAAIPMTPAILGSSRPAPGVCGSDQWDAPSSAGILRKGRPECQHPGSGGFLLSGA